MVEQSKPITAKATKRTDSNTSGSAHKIKTGDYLVFCNQQTFEKREIASTVIGVPGDCGRFFILNRPSDSYSYETFGGYTKIAVCKNPAECSTKTYGKGCTCLALNWLDPSEYEYVDGQSNWIVSWLN